MSRRTRRVLPNVLPVLLTLGLSLGLASCGEDEGGSDTGAAAFDKVQIEGEAGSEPEVTFEGQLETESITSEVITEGDGEEISSGDSVLAHLWIGNGFTQEKAVSTYETETPELLTVDEATLSQVFIEGVEGHTVGSRVAVLAPADEAFGPEGNPQLRIGNKDTVLVVLDLLSGVLEGPEGAAGNSPAWAPEIVEEDGVPTGFDFAGTKPSGKLRSATLVTGEGETVEKGQTIVVDYLGQEFDGKKPFDNSFSEQPTTFQIGVGQVVSGWDKTLVGANIGSRVLMAVPPDEGYGKQGNPQINVSGDDTLYFLVDILAAG